MKFVSTHLTRHHILHAPHRWFLAFVISPIHFAEIHYQNKYHLNFRHAKKLFVFDLLLLASVAVIGTASLWWSLYDPTVLNLVHLEVTPSKEKIQSGESVAYTFHYHNQSDATLESAHLSIFLPAGFLIEKTDPTESFDPLHNSFTLPTLPSGGNGQVTLTGVFYDTPGADNEITARLSYRQLDREEQEIKVHRAITTLRGSVLETSINTATTVVSKGSTRLEITLQNNGEYPLSQITVPLTQAPGITLTNSTSEVGTITNSTWQIESLAAQGSATLVSTLSTNLPTNQTTAEITFSPTIFLNNREFPQVRVSQNLRLVHPQIVINGTWTDSANTGSPGQNKTVRFDITNTGDVTVSNLIFSLPLPSAIVYTNAFVEKNAGRFSAGVFTVQKNIAANLNDLLPGQTTSLSFIVPIRSNPDGTDVRLTLTPEIKAEVSGVPGNLFVATGSAPTLNIGTALSISSEARYFTNEGDQLGRGPLPPQVGKETKYWVLVRLTNGSSNIRDLALSAQLGDVVKWTGRTSVSHGSDIILNEANNTISWKLSSLPARTTVGIHAEVALTPTAANQDQILTLLKNIQFTAHDTYIDSPLQIRSPDLDTSLKGDLIGQSRGVRVE